MNDTVNSLAHTSWNCKYHIVFAPKYRRQVFYKSKRLEIGQILRKLCEFKGVEITWSRSLSWSHSYVGQDTTKGISFRVCWIFERKIKYHDISTMGKCKVQISKPRVLVSRILCWYSRKEHKKNCRIHSKSNRRG